jgi:hypothetical protein
MSESDKDGMPVPAAQTLSDEVLSVISELSERSHSTLTPVMRRAIAVERLRREQAGPGNGTEIIDTPPEGV